jgi:hypothetical protein
MTGTIKATMKHGGYIHVDGGRSVAFRWRDCEPDVRPDSVGHDCRVRFYLEVVNGTDKAIGVTRECD